MEPVKDESKMANDESGFLKIMNFCTYPMVYAALTAAIELNLFEIIEKAGPNAFLSAGEIAAHLSTENQEAPAMLERMLRLLASNSILLGTSITGSDGKIRRLYGLAPMCRYLIPDKDGISLAPLILVSNQTVIRNARDGLKHAILQGGNPLLRSQGMNIFECSENKKIEKDGFNKAMQGMSKVFMERVLQTYRGFEGFKVLIDVGGGYGVALTAIVSKYPQIKGINFDLPHVITSAPACPGIQHVMGDMFQCVPKGEAIFLKNILHDWGDDQCLKLLKNCRDALPESGKVIIVDYILPEFPEPSVASRVSHCYDMTILTFCPGGRERTEREFHSLAKEAGFAASRLVCLLHFFGVFEFYKNSPTAIALG